MMVWSLSRRPRPGCRVLIALAILLPAMASTSEARRPATAPPKAQAPDVDGEPLDRADDPSEDGRGESAPEEGRDADDLVEFLGMREFVAERQAQARLAPDRPQAAHRAVGPSLVSRRAIPMPAVDLPTRLCRWTC